MVSFVVNSDTPEMRFLASLSDGTTVIQDAPNGQPHAWLRLVDYVKQNNLNITGLRLVYKNHQITLPSNQNGYYFSKRIMTVYPGNNSQTHIGCGYLNQDGINVIWCLEDDIREQRNELMPETKGGNFLVKNQI